MPITASNKQPGLRCASSRLPLVDSENADEISAWTGGTSRIVTLDKANHLLSNKDDARFVADEIATWFERL